MTTNGVDAATRKHFGIDIEVQPKTRARFISQLEGYINFIGQVRGKEDSFYRNLKTAFDSKLDT